MHRRTGRCQALKIKMDSCCRRGHHSSSWEKQGWPTYLLLHVVPHAFLVHKIFTVNKMYISNDDLQGSFGSLLQLRTRLYRVWYLQERLPSLPSAKSPGSKHDSQPLIPLNGKEEERIQSCGSCSYKEHSPTLRNHNQFFSSGSLPSWEQEASFHPEDNGSFPT
jgi:hypothetical protein